MADQAELERFAKELMRKVRDPAIEAADRLAAGGIKGPSGERWREVAKDESTRRALEELIPEIVDQTLFELLDAADNARLDLAWRGADGSCVTLEELGGSEMAGWLMGSGGWRAEYSSQRHHDPFSDLRLDLDDIDP
jgi:hypothetical protein